MNRTSLIISVVAVLVSFAGGFLIANSLNKSELETLRRENEKLKTTASDPKTSNDLSPAEIREKIAEADERPDKINFQRNLGTALYTWASQKQDADTIAESIRLLERAHKAEPDNDATTITLGHAYFDVGYYKKDMGSFEKARALYEKHLTKNPNDASILTDLGLTYFLYEPPDNDTALAKFEAAVKADPKNERSLEYLIQTLVEKSQLAEAEKRLDELTKLNPSNSNLQGLTAKVNELKVR
jgi:tetratricopeptide (TPR) repeat protein